MGKLSWWPAQGTIDLAHHDLPHPAADTEWWYVNSHLRLADGRTFGLFAAFFRIINAVDEKTGAVEYAHSYTWALSDLDRGSYHGESRVDQRAPELGLQRLANGRGAKDDRLNRAMKEILDRGQVPAPDRVFDGPVHIASDRLHVQYGSGSFEKQADGSYRVQLVHDDKQTACELVFAPQKQPIRHGDDGVVRGNAGEQMFYYFIPRCTVTGTITVGGETHPVAAAQGWYDHEFGGYVADDTKADAAAQGEGAGIRDLGWNWTAIQLDDGTDLTAYEIIDVKSHETVGKWMIGIDADSKRRSIDDVTFKPVKTWTSHRTFHDYPTSWRLTAPSAGIDLTIEAAFPDQELITVISKPAFWEGRCTVKGTANGRQVSGLAYIERSGFENIETLDDFFSAVGKEVRRSTAQALPLEPTHDELRDLIASEELAHYMDGVDRPSMAETLIKPIREMVDRGGKSWRSYAALACCDVVGGDSRKFSQWLAMPELLHVGSLIVDDVQDKSTVRRGGPCTHVTYGEPIAINSGTAAYFLTQNQLHSEELNDKQKLRIYDLYFAAMRAGHAGQAIDLGGMASLMPRVVETGDSTELAGRILACHRLKTAAPAGCLARMGAVAGGGTDEQIAAVGEFFEAVGLAFQIMDDVLNLNGFKGNLKQRGEDIANGVVTLPIAYAMSRLPKDQREHLWRTLQSKPTDIATIAATIELVQSCGAIKACADQARELVEAGWRKAEPLLDPSLQRLMLRAFGWYVLERHY
ncbi:MAG TPA: polyprenyl synthetase family protein [Kofleriaceae bacterium]|nr:polyprenyl synthetase family protein [Kofleriaceae bacterium]